jgi:hypothetical protein
MKKIIIILGISLTLFLTGVLHGTQGQQEVEPQYQVVRLLADELKPITATISPGTLLIWINEAPEMVDIQFRNVNIATRKIPCAGLESISLVQKGEFDYEVSKGLSKLKGKIIVQ